MKKIITITLTFAFLFAGIAYGLPQQAQQAEQAPGRERAIERIEKAINRIKEINPDFNDQGLRRALKSFKRQEDSFCYEFAVELEYEDEGEEVEKLQRALTETGNFNKSIDGVYSWDLARSLYEFQNENQIELEGVAKFGFTLEEEAREVLNNKFDCENNEGEKHEEEEEDEEDIFGVVTECSQGECGWVSTNCCPENAGANWECVNKEKTNIDCDEDVMCPQVISPKPTSSCKCIDGGCEGEANHGGGFEIR